MVNIVESNNFVRGLTKVVNETVNISENTVRIVAAGVVQGVWRAHVYLLPLTSPKLSLEPRQFLATLLKRKTDVDLTEDG